MSFSLNPYENFIDPATTEGSKLYWNATEKYTSHVPYARLGCNFLGENDIGPSTTYDLGVQSDDSARVIPPGMSSRQNQDGEVGGADSDV